MDKVVLLANPESNAWSFAEKIQDYICQEKKTHVSLETIEVNHFENGELDLHVPKNLRGKQIYFIHDSTDNPQEWMVKIFLLNNLFLLASASEINYVFPDIKYDRQDRKHKPRVPISATILPDYLKHYWPIVRRVFTMDLHSKQIVGNYSPIPIEALPSTPSLVKFLREKSGISNLEDLVIVAADKGDADRAEELSNKLNAINPPANIYKEKDQITRKITRMELVGKVRNKRVLIPDDIIDKGTTLCLARDLLKKEGAEEIYCYATHGLFTKGTKVVTDCFDKTIVSNTHNKSYDNGIQIMDVSPIFAEVIYRAQKGESVSELY